MSLPPGVMRDGCLDVQGAARFLGVSRSKLAALLRSGTIPSVRVGRRRLVPRLALEQWLESLPSESRPEDMDRSAKAARARKQVRAAESTSAGTGSC